MSCEELLLECLRERGLRLTPQRELVLAALHQLDGPATVEEIHARVHAVSTSVDISTVYRTLELFQEFQLVSSFDSGDGKRRYEHLGVEAPHHHLVCRACGQVIPVAQADLHPLAEHLVETYGFVVDEGDLTISGLCAACHAAERLSD
ncbi:MAG: Fur family transcriptional regulator [Anaerolineae bacterium]